MWKGRFSEPTAALLQQYSESISFDWRLWRHDIEGSIAHSVALLEAGLITKEDGLGKCNTPEELERRIAAAERGVFDDQPDDGGQDAA